ncbi:MAG: MFS transporter [Blastocatellia bacterium]|nr:MFS transporter [Blastocatellia bacterium]
MSTIVVVRKGKSACIAADTLTTLGSLKLSRAYTKGQEKIIKVDQTFIGLAGSAAHKLVLESYFSNPDVPRDFSSRLEVFETWRALHAALKNDYFLNPKEDDDDPYESTHMMALVANAHGIFSVYGLREVDDLTRFWAIGSGREYALGAMQAVYDHVDSAEAIARIGVQAAADFDDATALPLVCRTIELKEV